MPFTITLDLAATVMRTVAIAVLRRPTAVINFVAILFFNDKILHARRAELVAREHTVYRLLHDRSDTLLRNHDLHTRLVEAARVTGVARVDLPLHTTRRE